MQPTNSIIAHEITKCKSLPAEDIADCSSLTTQDDTSQNSLVSQLDVFTYEEFEDTPTFENYDEIKKSPCITSLNDVSTLNNEGEISDDSLSKEAKQVIENIVDELDVYANNYISQQIHSIASGYKVKTLPAMAIHATVGLGKSYIAAKIAQKVAIYGLPVLILSPTHKLAEEYYQSIKKQDTDKAIKEKICHYYGRQEPNGKEPNAWTCWKKTDTEKAALFGHYPAQSTCRECPHGHKTALMSGNEKRVENAERFFRIHSIDDRNIEPCRFLYEALPAQLSQQVLVMPIQSFSEAAAVWYDHDKKRNIRRLIIVDEAFVMSRSLTISVGDITGWLVRIEELEKFVKDKKDKRETQKAVSSKDEIEDKEKAEEIAFYDSLDELLPKIKDFFGKCQEWMLKGEKFKQDPKAQEEMKTQLFELYNETKKIRAISSGTAIWEKVKYLNTNNLDAFSVPLRALVTLTQSVKNGTFTVINQSWQVYELHPILQWAMHKGWVIFLDATMTHTMRSIIKKIGGRVLEKFAKQNLQVTRFTGHLYARGKVNKKKYSQTARAYLNEILRIAKNLPNPAAIITHKAYLQHADRERSAKEIESNFNKFVKAELKKDVLIGWFGAHDRGHNEWNGRNLAIVGMPLLSQENIALEYARERAALLAIAHDDETLALWPEFNKEFDDGKDNHGVPLPKQKEVRRWLLDRYAAIITQAIGRIRAVRHQGEPLQVQIWGGLCSKEMDEALKAYDIHISSRQENTVRCKRADAETIDAAVRKLRAQRIRISVRNVAKYLRTNNRRIKNDTIAQRLRELQTQDIERESIEKLIDTTIKQMRTKNISISVRSVSERIRATGRHVSNATVAEQLRMMRAEGKIDIPHATTKDIDDVIAQLQEENTPINIRNVSRRIRDKGKRISNAAIVARLLQTKSEPFQSLSSKKC